MKKSKTQLTEQALVEARRAYKKAWRARNKDKVKAANDRFYAKIAAKLAAEKAENSE